MTDKSITVPTTGHPTTDAIVSILTGIGISGLLLIFIWVRVRPWLIRIDKKAEGAQQEAQLAKKEVKNSHTINLRDDLDFKHDEALRDSDAKHAQTHHELAKLSKEIASLTKIVGSLEQSSLRNDKEISRINDTILTDREAWRKNEYKLENHIEGTKDFRERLNNLERSHYED